jgi:hypothetical protein
MKCYIFISLNLLMRSHIFTGLLVVVYLWENICTVGLFSVIGLNICYAPTPVQEFRIVSDNNIFD